MEMKQADILARPAFSTLAGAEIASEEKECPCAVGSRKIIETGVEEVCWQGCKRYVMSGIQISLQSEESFMQKMVTKTK